MKRLAILALLLATAAMPALAKPKPPAATAPPAAAAPAGPADADWRTPDPQNIVVIDTNKGRIILEISPTVAPNHAERIRAMVRSGIYDGRGFFRVIDNFMDQTGDPLDTGLGGSPLPDIAGEFTFKRAADTPIVVVAKTGGIEQGFLGSMPVLSQTMDLGLLTVDHKVQAWGAYCPGVAGMARAEDPDSANSQFYLMRDNATSPDHGTHSLEQKYTAWGATLVGQDVINSIKTGEPIVAAPMDKMITVKLLADMPPDTRPKIRVIDTHSAWFQTDLARQRAAAGIDFSVCAVKLAVDVK